MTGMMYTVMTRVQSFRKTTTTPCVSSVTRMIIIQRFGSTQVTVTMPTQTIDQNGTNLAVGASKSKNSDFEASSFL